MTLKKKKSVSLCLETLENRWVPTTIVWTGSTLLVENNVGTQAPTITVASSGNMVTVTAGSTHSTYNGVGNIDIIGGNGNTTYNLSGLNGYTGSLTLTTGNGADSVVLGGSSAGNSDIIYGNGADSLTLAAGYSTNGNVQFTGTSSSGASAFTTNGVYIGGSLTVTNAKVNLGADTIGGSVTINDGSVNTNLPVIIGAETIGQGLSVTTGNGNDSVTLTGTMVNGNASIYEGQNGAGNNMFSTGGTVLVAGNLTFQTGSGTNVETVGGTTTVQGTAAFSVGNGTDSFTTDGNFAAYTAFSLTAGNTNLTGSIAGAIGGPATFNLGNGTDSVLLTATVGGTLNWKSGNGASDYLTITPASVQNYNLNVIFSNGGANNVLTLNNDVVTGNVFLGVNGHFSQGNSTIGSPWMLSY